jgi:hypothetical protein
MSSMTDAVDEHSIEIWKQSKSMEEAELLRKTLLCLMSVTDRKTPHATLYVQTPYPSIPNIVSRIFPDHNLFLKLPFTKQYQVSRP